MKSVAEVAAFCARRFAANRQAWLRGNELDAFPLEINVAPPSEKEAMADLGAVKAWVADWRRITQGLEWRERQWRVIGAQNLPDRIIIDNVEQLAGWASRAGEWKRVQHRYQAIASRWPQCQMAASRAYDALATYSEADFNRLLALLSWLDRNRSSGLYHRQIPLVGMDTKWMEARKPLITSLVSSITGAEGGDFYATCGLLMPPNLVRFRILDPSIRAALFGMGDLTVPVEEFARACLPVKTVFIVENVVTGLACADLPGAIVIMGRGYAVEFLSDCLWLREVNIFYWGDIDTHGFAILSRVRGRLPHVRSILMDDATRMYQLSQNLSGVEESPSPDLAPANLTEDEARLNALLRRDNGTAYRFEQEQIEWTMAWQQLVRCAQEALHRS
ncbi:Wadjet anti-phage system protein JetD domain-containing protein [Massilia sp.]|uniref:Wadjet anti-phage system protein JetD domain-containing protein n=1 Tax=Massilia sp. TaxID=1882437 RepID=UPI003918EDD2